MQICTQGKEKEEGPAEYLELIAWDRTGLWRGAKRFHGAMYDGGAEVKLNAIVAEPNYPSLSQRVSLSALSNLLRVNPSGHLHTKGE